MLHLTQILINCYLRSIDFNCYLHNKRVAEILFLPTKPKSSFQYLKNLKKCLSILSCMGFTVLADFKNPRFVSLALRTGFYKIKKRENFYFDENHCDKVTEYFAFFKKSNNQDLNLLKRLLRKVFQRLLHC